MQAGKLEADTASAEQKALDLEQQLRDACSQLQLLDQDQGDATSSLQQACEELQAQLEQRTAQAQAAEVCSSFW